MIWRAALLALAVGITSAQTDLQQSRRYPPTDVTRLRADRARLTTAVSKSATLHAQMVRNKDTARNIARMKAENDKAKARLAEFDALIVGAETRSK